MRVFPVAELGKLAAVDRQHVGEALALVGKREPLADHRVVSRGRRIGARGHEDIPLLRSRFKARGGLGFVEKKLLTKIV